MQFVAYAAYRGRLESAFLADQLASATFAAAEAASIPADAQDGDPASLDALRPGQALSPSPDLMRPFSMHSALRLAGRQSQVAGSFEADAPGRRHTGVLPGELAPGMRASASAPLVTSLAQSEPQAHLDINGALETLCCDLNSLPAAAVACIGVKTIDVVDWRSSTSLRG